MTRFFKYIHVILICLFIFSFFVLNPDLYYLIISVIIFNFIIYFFYKKYLLRIILPFYLLLIVLFSVDYFIADKSQKSYFDLNIGDSETYLTFFKNLEYYYNSSTDKEKYKIRINENIYLNCKFNRIFIQNRIESVTLTIPYTENQKELIESYIKYFEFNLKFDEILPSIMRSSIVAVNDSTYKNYISIDGKVSVKRYQTNHFDDIVFEVFN